MDLVFGAHVIEEDEDTQFKQTSDQFIVHPGWDKEKLINDIALVKLRTPVPDTQYIKHIKIASGDDSFAGKEGV